MRYLSSSLHVDEKVLNALCRLERGTYILSLHCSFERGTRIVSPALLISAVLLETFLRCLLCDTFSAFLHMCD